MASAVNFEKHRRWTAPREDQSVLIDPPFGDWSTLLATNRERGREIDWDVQGRPFRELRRTLRSEAIRLATEYTANTLGLSLPEMDLGAESNRPIIVSGHQPEWFHPGVWAKNFALSAAARSLNAVPIQLVIDNDLCQRTSILVPCRDGDQVRFEAVPFDNGLVAPWEEQSVESRDLASTFAERVGRVLEPWDIQPLLPTVWPETFETLKRTGKWADALTQARGQVERRWGAGTLELPLSQLCELDEFRWFACALLARLPELSVAYNQYVADYRRTYRMRNPTRPVPDLVRDGDWLEAPFWIWRAGHRHRERLFARQLSDRLELRAGKEMVGSIPLTPDRSACCAVDALRNLSRQGWRLRTRALTTTWFARLFLADLFIHGIGGSHYDEMTDRLMTEWLGVPLLPHTTVTATARLPLTLDAFTNSSRNEDEAPLPDSDSQLRWLLNDTRSNPQRYVTERDDATNELLADRARLVAEQHDVESWPRARRLAPAQRRRNAERYRQLRSLNNQLSSLLEPLRNRLQQQRHLTAENARAARVLNSREAAWCLFPEETLRPFYTRFFPAPAS
jgi:hypothetical protein